VIDFVALTQDSHRSHKS